MRQTVGNLAMSIPPCHSTHDKYSLEAGGIGQFGIALHTLGPAEPAVFWAHSHHVEVEDLTCHEMTHSNYQVSSTCQYYIINKADTAHITHSYTFHSPSKHVLVTWSMSDHLVQQQTFMQEWAS